LFSTASHSEREQYIVYDFNSFFADVGGYLGLLLGHSLLSMYTSLAMCLHGRLCKK
jgi:hypothetical protein